MPTVAGKFLSGHRRWLVVGLLACFSIVNYLDRQALSVLAPTIRQELGFSTEHYSYIVSLFLAAYAVGYAFSGGLLDRLGVRIGLGAALAFWSVVAMAHGAVAGWLSLAVARIFLGLGQSFHSPGGIKAIAEWIPTRERGLCSAVFSNANSLGAVLAPPIVASLALWLGWRWAFVITGASGFVVLAVWWRFYRPPEEATTITEEERAHVLAHRGEVAALGGETARSTWSMLRDRRCLGLVVVRLFTDSFSFFISFWLIEYFQSERGFSLRLVAMLGWIPYLASPLFGGPLGGAASDWLVRRGVPPALARRRLLLVAASVMPLSLLAVHTGSTALAVVIIALLVAAQGCWMVNLLTLCSELVPRTQVGRLVALSGIGGSIGGILTTLLAGRLIATTGYVPVFTGLGFLHLFAFGILAFSQRAPTRSA